MFDLLEPTDNIHLSSSAAEMERFQTSVIWQDIVKVLRSWKEAQAVEFDTLDPEDSLGLARIQERRKALDYLIDLPTMLAANLMEAQDESGRD